jgi:hypothetical protein
MWAAIELKTGLWPLLATIRPMRPGEETVGDQPPEAVGEDAITC